MTDKFRLWRPKESFLPEDFPKFSKENVEMSLSKKVPPKNPSTRTPSQHRLTHFIPNLISNASGSCYIEQGHTKVLVTVHGPQANNSKKEREESGAAIDKCGLTTFFKYAPFSSIQRIDTGPESKEEKLKSRLLLEAISPLIQLQEYPKMVINISAIVLQEDGCSLPAAITACSVALASAGLKGASWKNEKERATT